MTINEEPVILDKFTPKNLIEIWHPLYSEELVLIHPTKVGQHNKIVFTKAQSLPGEYYLSGNTIKSCKKRSNGTVKCYAVPLSELRPLQINQKDMRSIY